MKQKILSSLLLAFASLTCANVAYADENLSPIPQVSNEWRFEVTPYVWVPAVTASTFFKDQYIDTAQLTQTNLVSNLKSGGMIAAEAHYGSWGIFGDIVSATIQKTGGANVTLATRYGPTPTQIADKATLQHNQITGGVSYTVFNNQNAYVDGLIGVRYISGTTTISLKASAGGLSQSIVDYSAASITDPVVGFKGRYRIADSTWYVPFYGDIGSGGGSNNMTWQGILGVGKTFEKWIDASLAYRYVYYDLKNGNGTEKATFKGPQLAVTFKF
ncbi:MULTISPECIES: hypothetical protein [unclassified Polynucleobacter]|jgi:hypothetical protein|uniref:hypothetical protein n=1 Tax=unclassified Polynucleobacter TaxID=2640945 RepID=UPI001C0D9B3C|nr:MULTISPECIES: hypothetical protein [unclassified Polynucleobacter]MBU3538478.1 hypothetical protein [Polynucleobacter sp. UK-Gri1-W3]MBU3627252.1 hypothetical protein [Polynucleobacter sp. JS-Safj-400b-B2]